MTAIPISEVFRAAEGASKCAWFRRWGKTANEADVQAVLLRLWTEQNPRVIANLLKLFSARPLAEFDARLIELSQHGDAEVRRCVCSALAPNAHPLVRKFALAELQKAGLDGSLISLFINNYQPGDDRLLLDAMELPRDACQLHWLLMRVIEVLEKNLEADCTKLGIIANAMTPCEQCRFRAARLLLDRHAAPDWLIDECRYDSGADCRKLAGIPGGSPDAS